ncbi:MAG TPA: FAD-dependent monooxygenase [Thermoanaerobaculia bacterium]|nr:FAD-dependent monooxygenase [Thermoanaerobaculia bacterium]
MSETIRHAVVIGAGPAGSAAAAILAEAGFAPLVIEKDRFPRRKVCGEFLSGSCRESLARLDALAEIAGEAAPIERASVRLRRGRSVDFDLSARAFGLSRLRLDEILARRAAERGAEIRFGWRVQAIENDGRGATVLRLAGDGGREESVLARTVVGAWGRWDALDRTLRRRFLIRGGRFFGWSRDYEPVPGALEGDVRLYLFRGGYCGLSRIEGGRIHLAGVISEARRRRLPSGWDSALAHARRDNPALDRDLAVLPVRCPDGDLGTGPVYFTTKPATERGALMAGDAAGVIDPFLGEGLSAALASGILAGETLASALAGGIRMEDASRVYALAWRRRLRNRIGWGAALRGLMLHPGVAAFAARIAGDGIAKAAIARLAI